MSKRIIQSLLGLILIPTVLSSVLFVPAFAEDNTLKYYLGSTVNAGKDTGYSENNVIDTKDPHYGWKLGSFFVSGYTSVNTKYNNDGTPIFLKTVGDTVSLWFNLEQNIDSLNGKDELTISEDKNGYDLHYGIEKTNFGRGTLIIQHTDYQNKSGEPTIYTDYLSALKVGADTKVDLFEEGDYEVTLDYEIKATHVNVDKLLFWDTDINWAPSYTNYRINFKFSVRNGNCMVFPFDVSTRAELTNSSATTNGFYLDLAKSRYLDINIKREVLKDGADGLTEDTRFNRPAKDGDQYTDEGIYTITVKNKYTDEKTTKVIYVGTNDILKAYVATGLSISEIEKQLALGASIAEDGSIIPPPEGSTAIPETLPEESTVQVKPTPTIEPSPKPIPDIIQTPTETNTANSLAPIIIASSVALALILFFVIKGRKQKQTQVIICTPPVPDPEEYTPEEIERLSSGSEETLAEITENISEGGDKE